MDNYYYLLRTSYDPYYCITVLQKVQLYVATWCKYFLLCTYLTAESQQQLAAAAEHQPALPNKKTINKSNSLLTYITQATPCHVTTARLRHTELCYFQLLLSQLVHQKISLTACSFPLSSDTTLIVATRISDKKDEFSYATSQQQRC